MGGGAALRSRQVVSLEGAQRCAGGVVVELLQQQDVGPHALDDLGHGARLRVVGRGQGSRADPPRVGAVETAVEGRDRGRVPVGERAAAGARPAASRSATRVRPRTRRRVRSRTSAMPSRCAAHRWSRTPPRCRPVPELMLPKYSSSSRLVTLSCSSARLDALEVEGVGEVEVEHRVARRDLVVEIGAEAVVRPSCPAGRRAVLGHVDVGARGERPLRRLDQLLALGRDGRAGWPVGMSSCSALSLYDTEPVRANELADALADLHVDAVDLHVADVAVDAEAERSGRTTTRCGWCSRCDTAPPRRWSSDAFSRQPRS